MVNLIQRSVKEQLSKLFNFYLTLESINISFFGISDFEIIG